MTDQDYDQECCTSLLQLKGLNHKQSSKHPVQAGVPQPGQAYCIAHELINLSNAAFMEGLLAHELLTVHTMRWHAEANAAAARAAAVAMAAWRARLPESTTAPTCLSVPALLFALRSLRKIRLNACGQSPRARIWQPHRFQAGLRPRETLRNRHLASNNAATLSPTSKSFGAEGGSPAQRAKAGTHA
jgi:hypothetical protein